MNNTNKSRKINLLSKHPQLQDENVSNVWNVNLSNTYTHSNERYLSKMEELERYRKSMLNRERRFNPELGNNIKERLKLESNKAMKMFNKSNKVKRLRRSQKTRRVRNI